MDESAGVDVWKHAYGCPACESFLLSVFLRFGETELGALGCLCNHGNRACG